MDGFLISPKLTNIEIIGLKECFAPVSREYRRGEIITICSTEDDTIGIITSGTAYLTTMNNEEQRRILEYYQTGNAFGKHFLPSTDNRVFYVTAKTNCTVDFIRYKKLITCCSNDCEKHITMINHLIMTTARKSLIHIDVLSQRTLRSKLMTFFEFLSINKQSRSFTLPLPLSDLADYMAVDRSAMMREIKKLNEENIIKSDKRKVNLLF